jgi:hypothetical protein
MTRNMGEKCKSSGTAGENPLWLEIDHSGDGAAEALCESGTADLRNRHARASSTCTCTGQCAVTGGSFV